MVAISALPPTLDLTLYAGDDVTIELTIMDDTGNPYDLTGTLLAQIRKGHDLAVLATIDCNVPAPTSGVVYLTLDAAATEALGDDGGRHSWDLQLTAADGAVSTLVRGVCSTTLDITETGVP